MLRDLKAVQQPSRDADAGAVSGELWYASFEALDYWGSGLATYCRHVAKCADLASKPIRIFQRAQGAQAIRRVKEGCVTHVFVPDLMSPEMEPLGYWMNLSWRFAEAICQEIDISGVPRSIEFPDGFALSYFLLQRKFVGDRRLGDIPVLICAHTPVGIIDEWSSGNIHSLPNWWTYRAEKWCCKAADAVITLSSMMECLMRDKGYIDPGQLVDRCSNPFVSSESMTPGRNCAGTLRIGMASRMVNWKGLTEALAFVRAATRAGQPVILEMCGEETEDFKRARTTFADVFSSGAAVYVGTLSGTELSSKRQEWDCQIHPSPCDNYPFTVLEALSSGLPCLITHGNGISETLPAELRSLLVCDFRQPADVLSKLSTLSAARELLSRTGIPALDHFAYFKSRHSLIDKISTTRSERCEFPFISSLDAKSGLRPRQLVPKSASGARLTVVIPYYNLGSYLQACVESILGSTLPTDVVIVNDGSTEKSSIDALQRYRNHVRVRVLDLQNGGVARARNAGVAEAQTEFVALLDADDTIEPSYYAKAVHVLDAYDNVGFVGCWANEFEDGTGRTLRYWPTYNAEPLPNLVMNNTNCQALIYRRALYMEAGQHDPALKMFLDDWDGMLGMLEGGYFGVMLPEPLFNYRQRPDSVFRSNGNLWNANYAAILRKRKALLERNASEALLFSNANGPNSTFHLLGWETEVNRRAAAHKGEPSNFKRRLVRFWDSLPRSVQKRVEPIADYIDRITA